METTETFPFKVREQADLAIRLADGRRLSARAWLPEGAGPVPCILEYLPYRKRDGTAIRDALTHPYLAGHGYACIRVDIQGTGESEGLFDDEYSALELGDGIEVINWIAAQPWCDGAVGMIGISWGGFNGLQLAALAPEPLKAVVSICSTADRFADDIHYKGGCLLGENAGWAATVLGWFGLPPDPALVGDKWRQMWLDRLEATPFLAAEWLRHQTRDAYWQHGSVCENYSAISAAVLSVGGWHDGYRNTVSNLVANLPGPVKGIVGPWNHKYPHFARPGPTIDFLGEMLRWFDRWLKGVSNGAEDDPAYRAYLMDGIAPATDYDHRPGRWMAEPAWPAPGIATETLHLTDEGLAQDPAPLIRKVTADTACGMGTGEYFPFGFGPGELPDDQGADDALSACFDGRPVAAPMDIVGAPVVRLTVAADQPRAQVAVRLCDVAPDGASALICHGFLNLRHRHGHDRCIDLTPGEAFDVAITLDQCAYRLPAGHRLRVAISPLYWPFIWPEREITTLSLTGGALTIPVRPLAEGDEWQFEDAKSAPPLQIRVHQLPQESKIIQTEGDVTRMTIRSDDGGVENLATGLISRVKLTEIWSIRAGDPLSARSDFRWERTMQRGDWQVRIATTLSQTVDSEHFHLKGSFSAYERDKKTFNRDFRESVVRD